MAAVAASLELTIHGRFDRDVIEAILATPVLNDLIL